MIHRGGTRKEEDYCCGPRREEVLTILRDLLHSATTLETPRIERNCGVATHWGGLRTSCL